MADPTRKTPSTPPARPRTPLLWVGSALVVVLLGLIVWGVSPLSPFKPGATPTPIAHPPTPVPPTATLVTDVPPTAVVGAATFTPEAGQAITGPHVLGITAGVGMRPGEVAGSAPIAVTFSEAMDQASAQAAFAVAPAVAGGFQWMQNTLLFTPNTALAPSTPYTITVGSEAKTSGGKTLAAPLSAQFTTAPPPAILRTLPSTGASEVPTDTVVTISFNRPMIPLTALDNQPDASQWIAISPAVAGRWVWLGTGAVGFRAETGFLPASDYTVEVKAGWPDDSGVPLTQGTSFRFTTIKPAILSVSPGNGASHVPLDAALVVRFNMAMDHDSVQQSFTPHVSDRNATFPGRYEWSADSTVMTFTPTSLLEFDKTYGVVIGGQVKPATGNAADLSGPANLWQFSTTTATHVEGTYPSSDASRPAQPSNNFGFSFNNPLAPDQNVAQYLTINPTPEGYKGQLAASGSSVFTSEIKLVANTLYKFELKAGLKDKWGFPVAAYQWQVQIGPLPPSLSLKGGSFQPIYSGGPTRVRLETANLDKVTLHLYALSENQLRDLLQNPPAYSANPVYPGQLQREWAISVPPGQDSTQTAYPTLALNGATDRLPAGIYYLRATAPSPYDSNPMEATTMLFVGRVGLVSKNEGRDLLVWAADLGSGKPVANYPLRVEQWRQGQQAVVQRGRSGADGVWRLKLDPAENATTVAVWSEQQGDLAFLTVGWSNNINPYNFSGISGGDNTQASRSALYTDRPIYRPAQTVYFRGILRLDDDALYSLPQAGATVSLLANTYSPQGETQVYTGTATLSQVGTFNGQFVLPADAPTGNYTLRFAPPGGDLNNYYGSGGSTASFDVEEYRKPDFQVNVTAGNSSIHGDPVTATVQTSYYFGGPLVNVTTTINLQSSPYYFGWSDPTTGEGYTFGDSYPYIYDYYRGGPFPGTTPQPVQSFQARTDKDGLLTVDVSRYVTTTDSSQSVLIEGQVQDLSNQAVANSTSTVVHQGLYYVGLRIGDYIATASQPTTITVRTIAPDATAPGGGRIQPNTPVKLRFVRQEWATDSSGQWVLNEVPAGETNVTSDAQGRATTFYTPPSGGNYKLIGESTDSRGNAIHSSLQFWVTSGDSGYVPWRYTNEQQVELVADKSSYKVGDTARILITSPFTQATGLLTIERGHLKRYQLVNIQGGAPTIEVKLEDGDLPNVYVGLTLLGPERPPAGAPADWGNKATMRQGYVNLSIDTSSKQLQVSIDPPGPGPFPPGTTATMTVHTRDMSGKPAPGELSLAVVDEAIYALASDNTADLFGSFWGERGLGVQTSSSFSAGDNGYGYRRGGVFDTNSGAAGAVPQPAAPAATESTARDSANAAQAPLAPQKVRVDFRDTAFWTATITTGPDGSAVVPVPLPDNLTTWRLTAQGITVNTLAGMASTPLTVTQPLLLRPVQPRFLTTGDNPHPQAIIHNNTGKALDVVASLVVSGALTLDAQPTAEQKLTIASGEQAVVTWSVQVGKGDTANLRYWVHTLDVNSPDYHEDAVGTTLPVTPFAAPETVATSGEVSGTRADEHIFLPYTLNPLLGELVVQVSPSLAAATTDSINYVKDYPYESTDQTVSRFLPLVVLEGVYNKQGLKTQFAANLPGIVDASLKRLAELQQADGGWAWWERGPSSWWETAYAVQGLAAARDAGYAVPADMLQRGIERLKNYAADNNTEGIDQTYHLNMRAYTLYVLSYAIGAHETKAVLQDDATNLIGQTARLSNHARAWLALGLAQIGMSGESTVVLDSLMASAKQTSTTAHWQEGSPDYWSGGTDNRATALAIDALVTLAPNDPLVPKAVRWLMSAEKEGHWLSSQETSISLISLAHYIDQSKELQANYSWQVSLFDQLLGENVANSTTLTRTTTLQVPVAGMPQNTQGDLILARNQATGKMYYQASLRYYVPGEGIKSRSEGLAITRSYYQMSGGQAVGDPIKEATAGDLVKVRLTLAVPETAYYVLVTDPLPAGLEGVNGSLNTTSFTERPPNPFGINTTDEGSGSGYYDWWWRWGPFDNVEMRDTQTVLFATYMSPGTYVYEYYARATTPGTYLNLPAHAELTNFPDVFGHSDGGTFTVK